MLGYVFPTYVEFIQGGEEVDGFWFEAFGAYFFAIGVFGTFVGIYYTQGCMILFLFLFIGPALWFLGYGGYILNKLDLVNFPF